jgi:hypothetical protein
MYAKNNRHCNFFNHAVAIPSDDITVETVSYSPTDVTARLTLSTEEQIGPGISIRFNVSADPPVGMPTVYNSSEVIQLTLLYNIVYNISIESLTEPYCGRNGASTLIQLKYSKYL